MHWILAFLALMVFVSTVTAIPAPLRNAHGASWISGSSGNSSQLKVHNSSVIPSMTTILPWMTTFASLSLNGAQAYYHYKNKRLSEEHAATRIFDQHPIPHDPVFHQPPAPPSSRVGSRSSYGSTAADAPYSNVFQTSSIPHVYGRCDWFTGAGRGGNGLFLPLIAIDVDPVSASIFFRFDARTRDLAALVTAAMALARDNSSAFVLTKRTRRAC